MLNINNKLFVDIKNFLNHPWSVTPENMVKHADEINQAAKAVTELRDTGKGPDGSLVLFPHLPYLLEENVLISEEEKKSLLSLKEKAKSYDAVISIGIGGSYLGNQVLLIYSVAPIGTSLQKKREVAILSSILQDKMWIQSPL